jgi:hypothetical protein
MLIAVGIFILRAYGKQAAEKQNGQKRKRKPTRAKAER